MESEGACHPYSTLYKLCDLRESGLLLRRYGMSVITSLLQSRELKLREAANVCGAPSLGLGLCARDAEQKGSCFSDVLGREGSSVYGLCFLVQTSELQVNRQEKENHIKKKERKEHRKGKPTAGNAIVLPLPARELGGEGGKAW